MEEKYHLSQRAVAETLGTALLVLVAPDPVMLPLLVGAGVDQVSVGAARLGEVRSWIRQLDAREAAGLFHSALTMDSAEEVAWAARAIAGELQAERHEASAIRAVP